jgi:hypothetical protein
MSMNESFATNMVGEEISFAVQPYSRGKGVITQVNPRVIKIKQFQMPRGNCNIEYEAFDVEVRVSEGSETGAFWGGVAVANTTKSLAGKTTWLNGVTYGDIYYAVTERRPIVIARCG